MLTYPKFCTLKEIPLDKNTNLSPVYYMPLGPNTFKIEPKVESKKYGEKEIVGWRIFIGLDITVSLIESPVFQIPIQKRGGEVAEFYDLYLDKRLFKEIGQSQAPAQRTQAQKQISHPVIEKIMYYTYSNYSKINSTITIDKLRDERKKLEINKFNYSILYLPDQFAEKLIIPTTKQKGYLNPEEADLLSLDDISGITLNIPTLSKEKKLEIEKLLNEMFLNDDDKNGTISTRDLLEIYSCIKDYMNGKQPSHNGIVLYGPPGSGKTHLIQSSLMKIYELLGFKTHFQEIGDMLSNQYVGGLATNVSQRIFGPAISLVKQYRVPCFVYIDEATDLLRKGRSEGDSGWRTQGIEAMKSFINRSRYPGIIVCLATNLEKSEFDDALTRDGRLYKIYLGLPNFKRCEKVWEYTNEKILFNEKNKSKRFNITQIEDLANICKDKINVAAITEISRTYVASINTNWDGNFDEFKDYFGNEAKKRLEDEFQRAKSNLEQISSGRFIGGDELKEKISELEANFKKQLHEIEMALDRNSPSTKTGTISLFQRFFSNKTKIPKRYENLVESLNNWKTLIETDSTHDPFSQRSITLVNRSLGFINWLNENLDDNNYAELKDKLNYIKIIFLEFSTINHNHMEYSNFDINKVVKLITVIESLNKKLDLNSPSSSKILPADKNSFLEKSGFQIADPRDLMGKK